MATEGGAGSKLFELNFRLFFYAEDEGLIRADQNPFGGRKGRGLIDRAAAAARKRFPTF
jgi:hypothetical protein